MLRKKQSLVFLVLVAILMNIFSGAAVLAKEPSSDIESEPKKETISEEVDTSKEIKDNKTKQETEVNSLQVAATSTEGKVVVDNIQDITEAIAGQTGNMEITFSDTFVLELTESIVITKSNNFNLVINGNGKEFSRASNHTGNIIDVSQNAGGEISFENIKLNGKSVQTGSPLLIVKNNNTGNISIKNTEFYNSTGGALRVSSSGTYKLNNVNIHDNKSINSASAVSITDDSTANITIEKSIIRNNESTGGGYEGGAISAKNYRGNLDINNTLLEKNKNGILNTGSVGGGGGAMAFHYLRGNINIKESYIKGNETNGSEGNVKSTYDGGAIYILDGRDGANFNIDKTTFEGNVAYDDGGAMMIQGTGNPGLTTTINNSTFFGNRAHGLDGANYSGGAIQFFKNGGSSKMTNAVMGTTFIGNEGGSELSRTEQRGGAIGLSGAGIFATAAVTRNDSLFIGNKVYNSSGELNTTSTYKDISNYATTQPSATATLNVINVDKGIDPTEKLKETLGTSTPKLLPNLSGIKAGTDYESIIIPTIPIRPESIADNSYTGSGNFPDDQRGFNRHAGKIDIGAVEISWIKYDANGGEFTLNELSDYDGTVFYDKDSEGKNTNYYDISYIGNTSKTKDGIVDFEATNEELVFKGWATTKEATEAEYQPGDELNYTGENTTLYAVWKEKSKFEVTYDANTGTGTQEDSNSPYYEGSVVTVLDKGEISKANHTFEGWNTKADGSGTTYEPESTFEIKEDTTLYAVWKEKVTDTSGSTKPTSPTDVSKTTNPKEGGLPKTGISSGSSIILIAGVILISIGLYFIKEKRKKQS